MSKPKVSIIVSNFNGIQLKLLKSCINSMIKPSYQNWELIVVDNASKDSSVYYLQKRFKGYKNCFIVQNPNNMYSQGLNLGARKATGKYLVYFNNDVKITKVYLTNIVKEFEKDKKLAIAQGKLLNYYKRKTIDSAGETMDIFGNPVTLGAKELDKGQFDQIEDILSASGSAYMIKREVFNKLGGYDPLYGIGYEDMDLSLRARRMGYKIKRIPKAILYHKRGATDLDPFIKNKVKWHFNKNRIITIVKNYPILLLVKTLPVVILIYSGIALYEWVIRKNWQIGWVRISSMVWCLLNLHKIIIARFSISKMGTNKLSEKEFKLFSTRSLMKFFFSFASSR